MVLQIAVTGIIMIQLLAPVYFESSTVLRKDIPSQSYSGAD